MKRVYLKWSRTEVFAERFTVEDDFDPLGESAKELINSLDQEELSNCFDSNEDPEVLDWTFFPSEAGNE